MAQSNAHFALECLNAGDTVEQVAAWLGVTPHGVKTMIGYLAPGVKPWPTVKKRPEKPLRQPRAPPCRIPELAVLELAEDGRTGAEIGRMLGVTRAGVYVVMDRLIAQGRLPGRRKWTPRR